VTPPLASSLLSRIEDAGINASAPTQQRGVDGRLVRFSPGKAKRARCIQAVAGGRMSVEEKLEICQSIYREHRLPLVVRVTPFSKPEGLDEHLAALGFERQDETCVMVASRVADAPRHPLAADYRIEPLSHRALADAVGQFRDSPLTQRKAHAERLETLPVPFHAAAVIGPSGAVAACGQYAIEDRLAGLYDVFTDPAERGSGLAEGLCRHLMDEARARGASTTYLQVEHANDVARRLYTRLGFVEAYRYHYRLMPDRSAA
jgi:ribosomal protein S18 acetylase RimI-like enzyme